MNSRERVVSALNHQEPDKIPIDRGAVYDVVGDFVDIGVDTLDPIQRRAAKMDIEKLKAEFGRDLIQADVTPDRFHAVFETALKYRDYPIAID